jgi:hypothetical protein
MPSAVGGNHVTTTEAVSLHPGEKGHGSPKRHPNTLCAREKTGADSKTGLQTSGERRKSQKITQKVHAGRGLETKWEMSVYISADCLKFRLKSFYENRQLP